jgi:hypothetical protein
MIKLAIKKGTYELPVSLILIENLTAVFRFLKIYSSIWLESFCTSSCVPMIFDTLIIIQFDSSI